MASSKWWMVLGTSLEGLVGLGEGFEGDGRDRDGWCWPDVITGWSLGGVILFSEFKWRGRGRIF